VLLGVGAEPAGELLPRRSPPNVLAAGDVVGPGHWTAAALDGAAAARRILGLPAPQLQPPYVWSDQFGLRLQVVGTPAPGDAVVVDGADESFAVRYLDRGGMTRAGLLANRQAEAAELRRELQGAGLPLAA
jgi:hypothetical protein